MLNGEGRVARIRAGYTAPEGTYWKHWSDWKS